MLKATHRHVKEWIFRIILHKPLYNLRYFHGNQYRQIIHLKQFLRVVQYSAQPEYDFNFEIPRPYMNLDRDIQIEEVKLGAKYGFE